MAGSVDKESDSYSVSPSQDTGQSANSQQPTLEIYVIYVYLYMYIVYVPIITAGYSSFVFIILYFCILFVI